MQKMVVDKNEKTAYNIAIAVLAVAIFNLWKITMQYSNSFIGNLEDHSAEKYDKSNCSAGYFYSGGDNIQFYDKSDQRGPDHRDAGGDASGSYPL